MLHLIWAYAVCLCPIERVLSIYTCRILCAYASMMFENVTLKHASKYVLLTSTHLCNKMQPQFIVIATAKT